DHEVTIRTTGCLKQGLGIIAGNKNLRRGLRGARLRYGHEGQHLPCQVLRQLVLASAFWGTVEGVLTRATSIDAVALVRGAGARHGPVAAVVLEDTALAYESDRTRQALVALGGQGLPGQYLGLLERCAR